MTNTGTEPPTILITVRGLAGSGKTTLAHVIGQFLESRAPGTVGAFADDQCWQSVADIHLIEVGYPLPKDLRVVLVTEEGEVA